ncbi:MAG: membrane protein insertase YidC [Bacteroidaceae bacterium]|nr:membrane protein insertase YidC [Bacteroidaceae bacterium]
MDKNTITGFVLIALVLIGFSWWSRPSEEQLQEMARQDSIARIEQQKALETAEAEKKVVEVKKTLPADSSSAFFTSRSGNAQHITLDNGKVAVTLNSLGGVVEGATLKGYNNQQGKPVTLLSEKDSHFSYALAGKSENFLSDELYFQPVAQSDTSVTFQATAANGGTLNLRYVLHPDSYILDFEIEAEGLQNYFAPSMSTIDLTWVNKAQQQEKGATFENRYSALTYKIKDKGTKKLNEMKDDEEDVENPVDWIDFKDQFFSSIIIAHQDFKNVNLVSTPFEKGTGYLKQYGAKMQTLFDPSGKQPTQMQFYLGPNDFHTLKSTNKLSSSDKDLDLQNLVYFGWPIVKWINRFFILYLFDWLTGFGLNMGIVLLLLTLIVKALVYPATKKSYLASARMRVLKPEVDKLNAKYPKQEDAMKKQQEMMQLYSQYGVSPMGGCLPALIQMPIWIALFNFIPNAIELRGESFLWATDLSAYDDVIRWGKDLWLIGDHISIFCLLFSLTNIGNTWISMRQQQANAMMGSEQQQQMKMMQWMMYLMPVFFFFMFNDYSSGLSYYYFLSGLTSILIMWALRRFTDDNKLLAQLKAYKEKHANDPKKVGGLAARLEAMQKMAEEQQRMRNQKK